jgi:hypothetical protein
MIPYSRFEWRSLALSMHGISLRTAEPASEDFTVSNFQRVGLHHVCYEIDDL